VVVFFAVDFIRYLDSRSRVPFVSERSARAPYMLSARSTGKLFMIFSGGSLRFKRLVSLRGAGSAAAGHALFICFAPSARVLVSGRPVLTNVAKRAGCLPLRPSAAVAQRRLRS